MPGTIHKQRVGLLMQEKLRLSKVEKRPDELKHLLNRHRELVKDLKRLVEVLKSQKSAMSKYNESRDKVVRHLAIMASTTPISQLVEGDEEGGLKTIHNELKAMTTKSEEEFREEIIDKVAEWAKTISERVQKEEKYCLGLRRDLAHYQTKVNNLHHSITYTLEKGKEVTQPRYEKRDRNDDKLSKAREDYETSMRSLEMYLARVTEYGWRDLVPIVYRLMTWDMKLSQDQSGMLTRLGEVVDGLEKIGEVHGFNPSVDCIESLKDKTPEALMGPENLDPDNEEDADSEAPIADSEVPMTPEKSARKEAPDTPETQASPASPERATAPPEEPMTPEKTAKHETPETEASPASPERTTPPSDKEAPSPEISEDNADAPEKRDSEEYIDSKVEI